MRTTRLPLRATAPVAQRRVDRSSVRGIRIVQAKPCMTQQPLAEFQSMTGWIVDELTLSLRAQDLVHQEAA
eukprot:scaffold1596_cov302-Pinguiococcus_pyrenoidosus.AAC.54